MNGDHSRPGNLRGRPLKPRRYGLSVRAHMRDRMGDQMRDQVRDHRKEDVEYEKTSGAGAGLAHV